MTTQKLGNIDAKKRAVAASSVFAAVVLTLTKLGIGLWTNSLGILSEAAHSGLDLVAAAITYWAVRSSSKPADSDHSYGHGKFENLSALFETLLLFGTCVWIIREASLRLLHPETSELHLNSWAFAVIIFSIVIDYGRSRALMKAAKAYHSQALEADAYHFASDIWSSLVVLIGLLGVALGKTLNWPFLTQIDSIAALVVGLIVAVVCFGLGKKSVSDLLDSTPQDCRQDIESAISSVPGVERLVRLRLRRSGPEVFADAIVAVDANTDLGTAHQIAHSAEDEIKRRVTRIDVMIHVEPQSRET